MNYGPTIPISKGIHETKYRLPGEPFDSAMLRISSTLSDNDKHRHALNDILLNMRFLPAGRVQAAIGSPRKVTPWNCFVSGKIEDSFDDIMVKAHEAGTTMRLGGGIGYNFSTLRPRGATINSLGSQSSGPVSFMDIYNSVCGVIASAGHRRGAQMGVLRVDHPDVEEFIHAKRNNNRLNGFNVSVGVTDKFMEALKVDGDFDLTFNGSVYKTVKAKNLWDMIMRNTWDWAEPGVLFIDRINQMNNLWYCEEINATNPCGEQPLPAYGACLLGSFNLTQYVGEHLNGKRYFDFNKFCNDIAHVVRAMDNIIDEGIYPLKQQQVEGTGKRRMGLGVTGVANALEFLGYEYGSQRYIYAQETILRLLRNYSYETSAKLAREKGPFPLFHKEMYAQGKFVKTLPKDILEHISTFGIRNSHLTSIAPTGTISLAADNVSSGIEPVFSYGFDRTIQTFDGPKVEKVEDYGYRVFGVEGKTANSIEVENHVDVLCSAQQYMDSAVSKTCNVGDDVTWDRFKDVYLRAYEGGAKGCTTFRAAGRRQGILNEAEEPSLDDDEVQACFIDPETGINSCGD